MGLAPLWRVCLHGLCRCLLTDVQPNREMTFHACDLLLAARAADLSSAGLHTTGGIHRAVPPRVIGATRAWRQRGFPQQHLNRCVTSHCLAEASDKHGGRPFCVFRERDHAAARQTGGEKWKHFPCSELPQGTDATGIKRITFADEEEPRQSISRAFSSKRHSVYRTSLSSGATVVPSRCK